MQAAAPGLKLVSGARRLVVGRPDAGLVKLGAHFLGAGEEVGFRRSHAEPEQMNPVAERGALSCNCVYLRLRRRHGCAAEHPDVRKQIEMRGTDLKGLHTAHRKAGERAVVAVGYGAEVSIYLGDYFRDQHLLECREAVRWRRRSGCRRRARLRGEAVVYHDEHWGGI